MDQGLTTGNAIGDQAAIALEYLDRFDHFGVIDILFLQGLDARCQQMAG